MATLTHLNQGAEVGVAPTVAAVVSEHSPGDLEQAFDGIVILDDLDRVVRLSPAAEELLELRALSVIGDPLPEVGGGELLAAVLAELCGPVGPQSAASTNRGDSSARTSARVVEVHRGFDRGITFVQVALRPTRFRDGRVAGTKITLRDVTEAHKTDELKNRYLSIVAHELRTPLTGIKTFASMMVKGALGQLNVPQSNVMESIREQVLRLEHQIDKLVHLGNLDSREFAQDLGSFDLSELAKVAIGAFDRAASDRGISIRLEVPDRAVEVQADRAQLRRAIQALIENAVKFSKEGGVVDVRVEVRESGRVGFCVADQGVGIDPRYHARIFEKFFQVEDPLTRHHGGSGLGLFFVKRIVEAHGSAVEVDSRLGSGARFSFLLQRVEERCTDSGANDVVELVENREEAPQWIERS